MFELACCSMASELAAVGAAVAEVRTALAGGPLSVMFDAVRCEEWLGADSVLPFTRLAASAGGGMEVETGVFTAPKPGIYLFCIQVKYKESRYLTGAT